MKEINQNPIVDPFAEEIMVSMTIAEVSLIYSILCKMSTDDADKSLRERGFNTLADNVGCSNEKFGDLSYKIYADCHGILGERNLP